MKSTGLTTVDDFKGFFKEKASERAALRQGKLNDKELRAEITEKVMTAVSQPD